MVLKMSKASKNLIKEINSEKSAQHWAKEFYDLAQEKDHNTKTYKTAITYIIGEYPDDNRKTTKNCDHNNFDTSAECTDKQNCFMKLLTNIDYEGLYFPISESDLSPLYLKTIKNIQTNNYTNSSSYKPNEYDLNNIPEWKTMKEFSSFRSMRRVICNNLAYLNIPPNKLSQLNYVDIFDIIKKHNIRHPERAMPSRRTKFLKMFAACYGEDFVRIETYFGRKKEAIDFLAYITYLGTTQKAPVEIKKSAEKYNVHHDKYRKNAKSNSNDHLTLCNKDLHAMLHYLNKNIDPKIVYFGTFSNYFHIYRDFEKERLYFQGIIPEYRIQNNNDYHNYNSKKTTKRSSKNKNKNKHKLKKNNEGTMNRIAKSNRNRH